MDGVLVFVQKNRVTASLTSKRTEHLELGTYWLAETSIVIIFWVGVFGVMEWFNFIRMSNRWLVCLMEVCLLLVLG